MNNFLLNSLALFLPAQAILLPLVILYKVFRSRFQNYSFQWKMHRALLLAALLLPMIPAVVPRVDFSSQQESSEGVPAEIRTPPSSSGVLEIPEELPGAILLNPEPEILNHKSIISFEWVFILSAALGFLFYLWSLMRESAFIKRSIINCSVELHGDVKIISSGGISAPFSRGVLTPSVYIPQNMKEREKEIIITHELIHIRENHLSWLNLEIFLKKVFWFNPLFYFLHREGELLRELICDNKSLETVQVKEYGMTLLQWASRISDPQPLACAGLSRTSFLKVRLEQLMNKSPRLPGFKGYLSALSLTLLTLSTTLFLPLPLSAETSKPVVYKEVTTSTLFNSFLTLSKKKGAYLASGEFDMIQVINSLSDKERELLPLGHPVMYEGNMRMTYEYGLTKNPFTGKDYYHTGVDIAQGWGTPLVATGSGEVVFTGEFPDSHGKHVVIRYGFGFYASYSHLDTIKVQKGDRVNKDHIIGTMGNTGNSTGPHLHYMIFQGFFPEETGYVERDTYLEIPVNNLNPVPFTEDAYLIEIQSSLKPQFDIVHKEGKLTAVRKEIVK